MSNISENKNAIEIAAEELYMIFGSSKNILPDYSILRKDIKERWNMRAWSILKKLDNVLYEWEGV